VLRPVAAVIVVTVLGLPVGVPPDRALLLGLAVGGLVAALQQTRGVESARWPGHVAPSTGAGWHQASLLESALRQSASDPARFTSRVAPRLRRLAEARLHRAGMTWDSPQARTALGPQTYDLLNGPLTSAPGGTAVRHALDRIEEIDVGTDVRLADASAEVSG
jgi:hypothetical protein